MKYQDVIEQYAQAMLKDAIKHTTERYPDRPIEQSIKDQHLANTRAAGHKTADEILAVINEPENDDAKHAMLKRIRQAAFHPDNKWTRKIFESITGISLTDKYLVTVGLVTKWLGTEFIDRADAALAAQREAERLAKLQAAVDENEARIARLKAEAPIQITGRDLVDLARYLGLEVNLRTAGVLIRKVNWMQNGKASVSGSPGMNGSWRLYRQVIGAIKDDACPSGVVPDFDCSELFGVSNR